MSFWQRYKNNKFIRESKNIILDLRKVDLSKLSDIELSLKFKSYKNENFDIVNAIACVLEKIKRKTGLSIHENQIICALAIFQGNIAEMPTGEGKTLSAIISSALLYLNNRKVHVFTANEYLVERDCLYAQSILSDFSINIDFINQTTSFIDKKTKYESNVLYITAREGCYNLLNQQFIKDLHDKFDMTRDFAIIDEVDYILIEEARSPMSISSNKEDDTMKFVIVNDMSHSLLMDEDFVLNVQKQKIELSDKGFDKIEFLSKKYDLVKDNESIYDDKNLYLIKLFENSLKAHYILKNNKHYLINESKELLVVDEHSGRVLYGRKWSDGLHQAVEAKEGLNISLETNSIARSTLQHFFKGYKNISGMTGTAFTEYLEFKEIYGLNVVQISANKPLVRVDKTDIVYQTQKESFEAAYTYIVEQHEKGCPVLVGTLSVDVSEKIYSMLIENGYKAQVLNAKNHKNESEIIQEAGMKGAITIATNMAGRGTDITLGGDKNRIIQEKVNEGLSFADALILYKALHDDVNDLGGLSIVGIERSHSRRLDNQLIGRSGRQGDNGSSMFFLSLEDDLIKAYGSQVHVYVKTIGLHIKNTGISDKKVTEYVKQSQKSNENDHFNMRKEIIRYSQIIEEQSDIVLDLRNTILELESVDKLNDFMNQAFVKVVNDCNEDVLSTEGVFLIRNEEPESVEAAIHGIFNITEEKLENLVKENYITEKERFNIYGDYLFNIFKSKQDLFNEYLNGTNLDLLSLYKKIALIVIDGIWCDHLSNVDNIRKQTQFSNFSKNNPVQVFGEEVDDAFAKTIRQIFLDISYSSFNVKPEDIKINID